MTKELQSGTEFDLLNNELAQLFADSPSVTQKDSVALRQAAVDLENNPQFQADYIKGRFVSGILAAMHKMDVTKSGLAAAWGKTRQYLSKVLDEDKRVNFTVETMVELSMLLNRRLKIEIVEAFDPEFQSIAGRSETPSD